MITNKYNIGQSVEFKSIERAENDTCNYTKGYGRIIGIELKGKDVFYKIEEEFQALEFTCFEQWVRPWKDDRRW